MSYRGNAVRGIGRPCRLISYRASAPRRTTRVICRAEIDEQDEPKQLEAVETVISAKLVFDDNGKPDVRYLAKWKVLSLVQPPRLPFSLLHAVI